MAALPAELPANGFPAAGQRAIVGPDVPCPLRSFRQRSSFKVGPGRGPASALGKGNRVFGQVYSLFQPCLAVRALSVQLSRQSDGQAPLANPWTRTGYP